MYRSRLSFRHLFFCVSVFLLTMLGFSICKPVADTAHRLMFALEVPGNTRHRYTLATNFSGETPAMTFLMHGLGGTAADWSNDYTPDMPQKKRPNFVQDPLSIIEKMRSSSDNGINLYRAQYHQGEGYKYYLGYDSEQMANDTITDFSRHTVVVIDFNINFTYEPIEDVYDKLHNIIDKFVYDYRKAKDKIPSINLIGHSMGGLLNMQYAIDHPKNVASLISMGTPYNGSAYNNPAVNLFIDTFEEQPCMCGDCGHSYYFCDLQKRRKKWNETYAQNRHIRFMALGGQVTFPLFRKIVESYFPIFTIDDILFCQLNDVLYNVTGGTIPYSGLEVLCNIFSGDICVDLNSQIAVGYDGVISFRKDFRIDNCNLDKRSENQVPVPHNLEIYDSEMINCILSSMDYGRMSDKSKSYTKNNIEVCLVGKLGDKWILRLTNNTNQKTSFEYNSRMCFDSDARTWNGLHDITTTRALDKGETTLIGIQEFGTANAITISYQMDDKRYIFYATNLSSANLTMDAFAATKDSHSYLCEGIRLTIVGRWGGYWIIKLTNETKHDCHFYYNSRMCFENDANTWDKLIDIKITEILLNDESTIVMISDYLAATHIVFAYDTNDDRKIVSATKLDGSGTMAVQSKTKTIQTYLQNNMRVTIIGKSDNKWVLKLANETDKTGNFIYNQKMCHENDAKNWTGLTDICVTYPLKVNQYAIIEIEENGTATHIAISYINKADNKRKIFYASCLNVDCTLDSNSTETDTYNYEKHDLKVSIAGKNKSKWLLTLTNKSKKSRKIEYNSRMCNGNDAENWTGLSNVEATHYLRSGESVCVRITENGTATHIAISYIDGDYRYIFYADNLDPKGTMTAHENTQRIRYTCQELTIQLLEKVGTRWHFSLTNNTGSTKKIEYNSKMCFEGDAINWTGLSDVENITLNDEEETEEINQKIWIEENGWATHVTFSYMDGNMRHVVYACELTSGSCTMNVGENTIDTSAPPSSCVAEGTLVTLADGSQKAVEELTGDEQLLVWNLETGAFDSAPIMFIDSDPVAHYEVVKLSFSDGTDVDVISEHGFYDADLNRYVYLDENASDYIGHAFMKQNGMATLTGVSASTIVTRAYSPVTYGHLCYYVNGMLSMPGGISGLFNYFDVDAATMRYDQASMMYDIERYGLYTYDEFSSIIPVSEEVFEAFNGRYLKVAIAKGMITMENIIQLVERYSMYL